MATLYLAGSIFILAVAASTWFQVRRIGPLVPVYFFTGWIAGELALQVVLVGAAITLVFAALGAFAEPRGVLGLALSFAAWGILLASYFRSHGAKGEVETLAREAGLAIDHSDVRRTHGFANPFAMKRAGVRRILTCPTAIRCRVTRGAQPARRRAARGAGDEPPDPRTDPRRRLDDRRQAGAGRSADGLPREPRLGLLRDQLSPLAEGSIPGAHRRREARARAGSAITRTSTAPTRTSSA
jgi:hypothetical protein